MYIRQGALRVLKKWGGARLKPRQDTREPALHASLIIVSETSHQATDTKSGSAIELQEKKQQKCVKVFATTKILMLRFRVAHCAMALCTLGVALSLEGAVPPPPSYYSAAGYAGNSTVPHGNFSPGSQPTSRTERASRVEAHAGAGGRAEEGQRGVLEAEEAWGAETA